MRKSLVIFGEDWGRHPSSTQHLAMRLANHYEITWVNSVGLRAPRLNISDFKRLIFKALGFMKTTPQTKQSAPFTVMNLPALPFPASRLALWVNSVIWRKKLAHLADKQPLLWASLPSALACVGQINEARVIYYCGDDFNALAGVDHKAVSSLEKRLVDKSDVIFTVSDRLTNKFKGHEASLLPHGVDYDLFANPVARASDLPKGKPIAGFYGSLSNWIDIDMLCKACDDMPDWNFVFIGDEHVDVSRLKAKSNAHFLGSRAHHSLPSYVQHFDVALLPFVDNEQIRACNPLKLREYLASGTAVVSSYFEALEPYIAHIEVCDADNLAQKIAKAYTTKSEASKRQAAVLNDSWEARALEAIKIMERIR